MLWIARIAGCVLVAFASVFALDAFKGQGLAAAIPDFAAHLVPAAALAAVVVASWRRPWIGAVAFSALAAAYAASTPARPDWLVVVAGPLVVTAVLFGLSALATSRRPTGSAG